MTRIRPEPSEAGSSAAGFAIVTLLWLICALAAWLLFAPRQGAALNGVSTLSPTLWALLIYLPPTGLLAPVYGIAATVWARRVHRSGMVGGMRAATIVIFCLGLAGCLLFVYLLSALRGLR
ncbi:MAG TPA: hypothetical protein VFU76_08270 [Terriglobales bacterium]|nr:hypothetical protein [Terriglobales bacterium]